MGTLRETVEADLATTLEGDYGQEVTLIPPDGVAIGPYYGQVLYDTRAEDPEMGGTIIVHKPVVTLRRSSLARIPANGEKWFIDIPSTPVAGAPIERYVLDEATEDGGSIGFIRLYLKKVAQV